MHKKWVIPLIVALIVAGTTGCKGGKPPEQSKNTSEKEQSQKAEKSVKSQSTANKHKGNSATSDGKSGHIKIADTKKEQAKWQTTAMAHMETNLNDVSVFLQKAEQVIIDLEYFAATLPDGKEMKEDGLIYRQLPKPYNTRDGILAFFQQYWSRPLAVTLYDHLDTKIVDGNVYLSTSTRRYPVFITTQNMKVSVENNGLIVEVTGISPTTASSRSLVRYHLGRDHESKRYEITKRSGIYGQENFQ
ncbi:hypothetical protein [Brevibacillus laterosporus]|uniref:Uncharacterized protein n=1 Tax=Brevibacillus laterosporus TaxID=1465 RepID=A0AAP3DHW8_BRELA|nr:hypothetical protein [Brevibacillus laterosporus]MCR8980240.1 hypothetical protein [Brevibacillus laterosporus]MCZ0807395.1 hypothetical protein [Brevibacillus laterosporus]MCZ0825496.1 hypothetical protein [Brevibacillus laterosporus]MCZ0849273.1 hypothetical protein [Brevibacillus laterosporus]MED1664703.1 hypothetical protein [Brevibacillus laterosporus]